MTSADLLAALGSSTAKPDDWASLVDRHGARLYAVAYAAAGPDLGDDAFQEGLIAIRHGASRFRTGSDPEASALAWLVTVVHRTAIDLVRRETRRWHHEIRAMPAELTLSAHDEEPEIDAAITARIALRVLDQLPERHQEVIRLRLLAGLDAHQAAAIIGCPTAHVHVRLQRALIVLRKHCTATGRIGATVAMPSLIDLEHSLSVAVRPPAQLPVVAHQVALEAFTRPILPAKMHLGVIMPIPFLGLGIAAILVAGALPALWGHATKLQASETQAPPETFHLAPSDYPEIEVSVDFVNQEVGAIAEFFSRVIRIPVQMDPKAKITPPCTVMVTGMKFSYAMDFICRSTNNGYLRGATGDYIITPNHQDIALSAATADHPTRDPSQSYTVTATGVTGTEFLRLFASTCSWRAPTPLPDYGPDHLSFRASISDPDHQERLFDALLGGYRVTPHRRLLHTILSVPSFDGTIDDALLLVSRLGGIPCRVDVDSGPAPLIHLPAARIMCQSVLRSIASAAFMHLSQSADGMVMYRPEHQRYSYPGGTVSVGIQGKSENAVSWGGYRKYFTDHPTATVTWTPYDAVFAVSWRDLALRDVARDLQRITHLPVRLEVEEATAATPILLELPERPLYAIRIALESAANCRFELIEKTP
jgi:RNA polymerase sigma-70 factor (ECF subfamily)